MYKKYLFSIFILIAIIQLGIPIKSIYDQEDIIKNGKEFKFQTAPVDPNDPFRGKYIALNFKEDTINVSPWEKWKQNDEVYASLEEDDNGFVNLIGISRSIPENQKHYILVKIQNIKNTMDEYNNVTNVRLQILYPFDRYYMEESKAKAAENLYRESNANQKTLTYAIVNIKNGDATLRDVMIDGVSIKELVEEQK